MFDSCLMFKLEHTQPLHSFIHSFINLFSSLWPFADRYIPVSARIRTMKRRSSPICLLAFALLLSVACTVGGVLLVSAANDGHDHYDDGQHVPLFAAKIWPRSNPSESYYYEQLPFCKVTAEDDRNSMSLPSQSLGADLSGVRYVPVPYDIVFPHDIVNAQLCTVHLDKDQVESFRSAIDREFVMLMYLDDLPFKVPVGFKPQQQQQRQRQDGSYPSPSLSLYTHMQFTIEYNAQLRQIIEVNVVQDSRTDRKSVV